MSEVAIGRRYSWRVSDDAEVTPIDPAATGRRVALVAMIQEFQQAVGSYLIHLVGEREVALALTEETFLCAYHAQAEIRPGTPLRPWLYRIATRLAYRYLRGRPSVQLPGQQLERGVIQFLLQGLQPSDRAVLLICDLEQMPSEEAATILGMSTERLYQRLARARARFRYVQLAQHSLITSHRNEQQLSI